jgi:hypothetical protein
MQQQVQNQERSDCSQFATVVIALNVRLRCGWFKQQRTPLARHTGMQQQVQNQERSDCSQFATVVIALNERLRCGWFRQSLRSWFCTPLLKLKI